VFRRFASSELLLPVTRLLYSRPQCLLSVQCRLPRPSKPRGRMRRTKNGMLGECLFAGAVVNSNTVHTLLPPGEATEASKLESSQHAEHPRYTSDEPVAHYESPNKTWSTRRCTRKKMTTCPCSIDDSPPIFKPVRRTSTDDYQHTLQTTSP